MAVLEQTFREQAAGQVKQVAPLRFMNRGMRMVVGGLEAQNKNGLRVSVTGGEALVPRGGALVPRAMRLVETTVGPGFVDGGR